MLTTVKSAARAELIERRIYKYILLALNAALVISYLLSDGLDLIKYEGFKLSSLTAVIFMLILLTAGLFSISLFSDMHSPDRADVSLSLPLTAKGRFAAKGALLLRLTAIPYLAGSLSILAVSKLYTLIKGYSCDIFLSWLSLSFEGLICLIFVVSSACVCSSLCSTRAGAAASTAIWVVCFSLLPWAVYALLISCANVSVVELPPFELGCFGVTGIIHTVTKDTVTDTPFCELPQFFLAGAVNIILSAGMMLISLKAYISRDRKSIFENRLTRPFMLIFMSAVIITAAAGLFCTAGLLSVLIAAAAAMAIYFLILTRSTGGGKAKWAAAFAFINAAVIIFLIVAVKTDGLGVSRLPKNLGDDRLYCAEISDTDPLLHSADKVTLNGLSYSELERAEQILESFQSRSSYEPSAGYLFLNRLAAAVPAQDGDKTVYVIIKSSDLNAHDEPLTACHFYIKKSDYAELLERLGEIHK